MPPLPSQRLQALANSNEAPLDVELGQIQIYTSQKSSQIASIESEVSQLKRRLAELETERDVYKAVGSAYRRFPNEIWREVFLYALAGENSVVGDLECRMPWPLTFVCSRWRMIALSFPALWTNLTVSVSFSQPLVHYNAAILLLGLHISRSGSLPLSVILASHASDSFSLSASHPFIIAICPSIPRWKSLHIVTLGSNPMMFLRSLQPVLEAFELSSLQKAFIQSSPIGDGDSCLRLFERCPALRSFGCANFSDPGSQLEIPWRSLTKLILKGSTNYISNLRKLTRQMESLQSLVLDDACLEPDLNLDDHFSLPELQFLCVEGNTGTSSNILEYLRVPKLLLATITCEYMEWDVLDPFLRESGCRNLTRLTLFLPDCYHMPEDMSIVDVFQAIPDLKFLEITKASDANVLRALLNAIATVDSREELVVFPRLEYLKIALWPPETVWSNLVAIRQRFTPTFTAHVK